MNHNPGASSYLPEAIPYPPHSNLPEVYHSQNHAAYPSYPAPPQQPSPQVYSPSPSHPPRYSELAAGYEHASPPAPKAETAYREEQPLPPGRPWWRRHLLLLCVLAVLIVGAAVGGGVGGALAAEKKKEVVGVDGPQDGVGAGWVVRFVIDACNPLT